MLRVIFVSLLIVAASISCISQDALSYYKTVYLNGDSGKTKFETKDISEHSTTVNKGKFYFWYSNNQIHTTQGAYSGKLLHGSYSSYYLNNNLKEQGKFKNGLQNGEWLTWYENGNLKAKNTYCNGELTGNSISYDLAGKSTIVKYRKGDIVVDKPKEKKTKEPRQRKTTKPDKIENKS